MRPRRTSLILLNASALLVTAGGAYDAFVPSLPSHVLEVIGGAPFWAPITFMGLAVAGLGLAFFPTTPGRQ